MNRQHEDTHWLKADQQSVVQQTTEFLSIASTKDAFISMCFFLIWATKLFRVILVLDGCRQLMRFWKFWFSTAEKDCTLPIAKSIFLRSKSACGTTRQRSRLSPMPGKVSRDWVLVGNLGGSAHSPWDSNFLFWLSSSWTTAGCFLWTKKHVKAPNNKRHVAQMREQFNKKDRNRLTVLHIEMEIKTHPKMLAKVLWKPFLSSTFLFVVFAAGSEIITDPFNKFEMLFLSRPR